MTVTRVVPNIESSDLAKSRAFYKDFLGMEVRMDVGWIVTLVSPSNPTAQASLLDGSASESKHPVSVTIEAPDVE